MSYTLKNHLKKAGAVLLAALLSFGLLCVSAPTVAKAADGLPDNLITAWDMENLPADLYTAGWAHSQEDTTGGLSHNYTEALKGTGKGYQGSTAVKLQFNAECPTDQYWASGWNLLIEKDSTAVTDWYGLKEVWLYVDASEFQNCSLNLDIMIDGVHPELYKPCWLVADGKKTEAETAKTWSGATTGRVVLPTGFKGWVGLPASAFKTTFGIIKTIGFEIEPGNDAKNMPLSLYIDQISIVKEDTSKAALRTGGDLFNKGTGKGTASLTIDVKDAHQVVLDYSASGAWSAPFMGDSPFIDEALRLLFTDEGAGLNGYRHNVGGGVKLDQEDVPDKKQEGRFPLSPLTQDGKYDENRDPQSLTILKKLVKLGTIDNFTLFMNTPPSSMTKNAMTSGDPYEDNKSNLREDCVDAYAKYVVDMVQLYNYLGVPVSYVSPINEPQLSWDGTNQEGCHYGADEALNLILKIIAELNARKAEDPSIVAKVSVAESNTWTDKSFVNYFVMKMKTTPDLYNNIDHLCAHSYGTSASQKTKVKNELNATGVKINLRETEYGPSYSEPDLTIRTALDVARVMYEDLTILDVDSWSYWRAIGNGCYTDSLVYSTRGSNSVVTSKRLWAMGNYARFTKGATRVGVDESAMPKKVYSSAYVNPRNKTLVVVVVNEGNDDQTFSFGNLKAGSVADVYETSAIRDLAKRGTMTVDDGYVLPGQSITTFVFNDQDIDYSFYQNPYAEKDQKQGDPTDPTDPTEPEETKDDPTEGSEKETDPEETTGPKDTDKPSEENPTETQSENPENPENPVNWNLIRIILFAVMAVALIALALVIIKAKKAKK